MEPIPETLEAITELADAADSDLLAGLKDRARLVRSLVPDCVGLSLASVEHGVTFTLVATSEEIATLDGIQHAFGGPCVDAAHTDEVLEYQRDGASRDELDWQDFARAAAAGGIGSTLSLPILEGERVIGTVNLYAASPEAFTGRHNALAVIFDAWAPGAVTNADLTFATRETARHAPQKLRDDSRIQMAAGVIAFRAELPVDEAHHLLTEAARRAGVAAADLAEIIIETRRPGES